LVLKQLRFTDEVTQISKKRAGPPPDYITIEFERRGKDWALTTTLLIIFC
jgi:hypothetical protein